ncbi:hypothetical protein D3C76_1029490 [compost metagenome]
MQHLGLPLCADPGACPVGRARSLTHAKQHQFRAAVQVQGKPVPPRLSGRQRLAAPFPIKPGVAGDRNALAFALDFATDLVERLAVVVRRLTLAGFFAVALCAMQHQRPRAQQVQAVSKTFAAGDHLQLPDVIATLQRPVIYPGPERLAGNTRLADTAARQGFAGLMATRAGQRRMPHPQVGAAPVGSFRAGAQGRAEQGPLCPPLTPLSVLEIGGDVPPLDAKAIVRSVIARKLQYMIARHLPEGVRLLTQAGKTFVCWLRLIATAQQQQDNQSPGFRLHRQIASITRSADAVPIAIAARR